MSMARPSSSKTLEEYDLYEADTCNTDAGISIITKVRPQSFHIMIKLVESLFIR